jgi:chromosome segregation ATPase
VYLLGEHADDLISAAEERDNLRRYRDEAERITENVSKALFPNSPRDSRIAEFLLDGMGACQAIERLRAERDSLKDDLAGIEDALASAGVWGNAECEAPTMIEAIECLAWAYRTAEAERDALQSKVSIAEETGVRFCELEDGGVGCSVPMSKELDDATGAIVTLTDQRDALALELKSETLRYCGATQELGKLQGLCDSQATEIERMRTLDIYRCRDLDILTEQLKALGDERNAIREERDTLQCKLADVTHVINQREAAIREAIDTRFASQASEVQKLYDALKELEES